MMIAATWSDAVSGSRRGFRHVMDVVLPFMIALCVTATLSNEAWAVERQKSEQSIEAIIDAQIPAVATYIAIGMKAFEF